MTITIDQVVQKYVELRDALKVEDEAHAAAQKPKRDALVTLEAWLLDHLNKGGMESVRTEHGTAFKAPTFVASIEDWDTFLGHVVSFAIQRALAAVEQGGGDKDAASAFCASPELNFLIHGVNKTAVREYMEKSSGQVPPGVKTATIIKVNVRRS